MTTPEGNLTELDFDCRVTKESRFGFDCWVYLGSDFDELIAFSRKAQSYGERFYDPLTADVAGAHHAILDKQMVRLVLAMQHYHQFNDYEQMAYPNDFPVISPRAARGFSTNYNYLVHFGLLGKVHRDGEVYYWVTDLGRRFIGGCSIRCELYNVRSEVVGWNDQSWGTITDYFSEGELRDMEKPLWFLPEKHRQDILTPEELAA